MLRTGGPGVALSAWIVLSLAAGCGDSTSPGTNGGGSAGKGPDAAAGTESEGGGGAVAGDPTAEAGTGAGGNTGGMGTGATMNNGGTGACQPSTKRCNDNAVESCTDEGVWRVVTSCELPETCNGNACADVTKPTIESITPADGATGVASNANVVIKFSEAMDHASVEAAFTQTGIGLVSFTWNGNTVTVTPGTALAYASGTNANVVAKSYKIALGTEAKDLAGNSIAAATSSAFTTLRRITSTSSLTLQEVWQLTNYNGGNVSRPGPLDVDTSITIGDGFSNEANRGVVDFDLLAGGNALPGELESIESASLISYITVTNPIDGSTSWGDPLTNLGDLVIDHVYFGDITKSLPFSAFNSAALSRVGALMTKAAKTTGTKTIDVTAAVSDDFKNRGVRGGRTQYRFQFDKLSNNDSKLDLVAIKFGKTVDLKVVYLIP